jgi:hypothetical protein
MGMATCKMQIAVGEMRGNNCFRMFRDFERVGGGVGACYNRLYSTALHGPTTVQFPQMRSARPLQDIGS